MASEPVSLPSAAEAARTGMRDRPDAELPGVAAQWLAEGLDSPELRELAGFSVNDGLSARRLLPEVLRSVGSPIVERDTPWEDAAWRGYWDQIAWAVQEFDGKLTTYAAGQRVLEVLGDVPELWEPGRGRTLQSLLSAWDAQPLNRLALERQIREHLRSLDESDVTPQKP